MPRRPPPRSPGGRKIPRPVANAQPWERRADESIVAYERFCRWRDAASPRPTFAALGREFGVSKTRIEQHARAHAWQDRLSLYVEHLSRIAQNARAAEIVEMNRRQASLGQTMVGVAGRAVATLARKAMDDPQFTLDPVDIARLGEHGAKIERLARGEATEAIEELPAIAGEGAEEARQESPRELARRIARNPRALDRALELARELEAEPGSADGPHAAGLAERPAPSGDRGAAREPDRPR